MPRRCTVDHALRAGLGQTKPRPSPALRHPRHPPPLPDAGTAPSPRPAFRPPPARRAIGCSPMPRRTRRHVHRHGPYGRRPGRDDRDARCARRGRQSGLSGMAEAMLYDRRIWVLRPFLSVRTRATIRDYLSGIGLGWIDDPSNVDRRYERVRVRLDGGELAPDAGRRATTWRLSTDGRDRGTLRRGRQAGAFVTRGIRVVRRVGRLPAGSGDATAADPPAWRAMLALAAVVGGRRNTCRTGRPRIACWTFVDSGAPGADDGRPGGVRPPARRALHLSRARDLPRAHRRRRTAKPRGMVALRVANRGDHGV